MDQARDLAWGARIATGEEYPTLGPAMRNRIYLGAIYYYFWAVPFFFSSQPAAAYVFAGLLGVLATALTFEVGRRIAGGAAGLAAALVFATMPLAVIDGRVAWAPAALPALCGGFLLAIVFLLERASLVAAIVAAVLAGLMVQLHIAAAPVVLVGVAAVLSQATRLGVRGVFASGLSGALVVLPTLWAATFSPPVTDAATTAGAADVTSGRLLDLLFVGRRAVAGMSLDPAAWPGWISVWLGLETAWIAVVLACVAVLIVRLPMDGAAGPTIAVLGMLLSSFLAVLLLPWEAWHYYLDVSLVPAALVVGLVVATVLGRPGWWMLGGLAIGRAALLVWWIHAAHTAGYVGANLELLRLGGPPAAFPDSRARVPTVATRGQAADTLVLGLGIAPPGLWQRAHGPGFSDLDTDNGFFFARAVHGADEPSGTHEVVVTYRGEVPPAWRSGQPAPIIAGPLEFLRYEPWLDRTAARLVNCGGGPLPLRPGATPLDYGDGALPRMQWPCPDPVVSVPLRFSRDDDVVLRLFARFDGPGRVLELEVAPPARVRVLEDVPRGLGRGFEITGRPGEVRLRLAIDGPASLDLFELRGRS